MVSFSKLGVQEPVIKAMKKMGWKSPTPVQAEAIPVGLEGKDLFAQAQTGTGKTGAFGAIILGRTGSGYKTPSALIVAPTRELAIQISEELSKLSVLTGHVCMPIYGGVGIERQIQNLKKGADIVIGTPGRLKDLLTRNALRVSKTSIFVMDEADRMLDMGFTKDLDFIISKLPKNRQNMLFSATMPEDVRALAMNKMKDPVELLISKDEIVLDLTSQYYMEVDKDSRKDALCTIVDKKQRKTIVFSQTKRRATQLGRKLLNSGYRCEIIHGDVPQAKREKIVRDFKDGKADLLIATDVAARGLDIDDVGRVINYDITDPETYVHRIGRTGRAGKKGVAITFIMEGDEKDLKRIVKATGKEIEKLEIDIIRKDQNATNAPKTASKGKQPKATKKRTDKKFAPITVTVGTKDGINKKELCDLIWGTTGTFGKAIGTIEMREKDCTVEVDPMLADHICKSLSKQKLNGREISAKRV